MPYLWSLVAVVVAVVALALLAVSLLGPVRGLASARSALTEDVGGGVRTLSARVAALRLRRDRRRA